MLAPLIAAIPMIAAGKVRGLAVSGGHRAAAAAGSADHRPNPARLYRRRPGTGCWRRPAPPNRSSTRLSAEFDRIVHQPDIVARFAAIGGEPVGGPPATLAALIRADPALDPGRQGGRRARQLTRASGRSSSRPDCAQYSEADA